MATIVETVSDTLGNKYTPTQLILAGINEAFKIKATYMTVANKFVVQSGGQVIDSRKLVGTQGDVHNVLTPTYPDVLHGSEIKPMSKSKRGVPVTIAEEDGFLSIAHEWPQTEYDLNEPSSQEYFKNYWIEPCYTALEAATQRFVYDKLARYSYLHCLNYNDYSLTTADCFTTFDYQTLTALKAFRKTLCCIGKPMLFLPSEVLRNLENNILKENTFDAPQNAMLTGKGNVKSYMGFDIVDADHVNHFESEAGGGKFTFNAFSESSISEHGIISITPDTDGGKFKAGEVLYLKADDDTKNKNMRLLDLPGKTPTWNLFSTTVMEDSDVFVSGTLINIKVSQVPSCLPWDVDESQLTNPNLPKDKRNENRVINGSILANASVTATGQAPVASGLQFKPLGSHYKCFVLTHRSLAIPNPKLGKIENTTNTFLSDSYAEVQYRITKDGQHMNDTNNVRISTLLGSGVFKDDVVMIPFKLPGM